MPISDARREEILGLVDGYVNGTFDEVESRRLRDELLATTNDPEELHLLAENINWDDGVGELVRIAQHPACELGTALSIYWLGEPHWHRVNRAAGNATYDLLKIIETRQLAKGYSNHLIPMESVEAPTTDQWDPNEAGTPPVEMYLPVEP